MIVPSCRLIRASRGNETIAQDELSCRQGRANHLRNELGAGGHEEKSFAADVHGRQVMIEQDAANAVANWGPPGIPAQNYGQAGIG